MHVEQVCLVTHSDNCTAFFVAQFLYLTPPTGLVSLFIASAKFIIKKEYKTIGKII